MNREQLVELLRTGRTDVDANTERRTVEHRIQFMDEQELREAVIEFVYSK